MKTMLTPTLRRNTALNTFTKYFPWHAGSPDEYQYPCFFLQNSEMSLYCELL